VVRCTVPAMGSVQQKGMYIQYVWPALLGGCNARREHILLVVSETGTCVETAA
jgi:hypothetical protein